MLKLTISKAMESPEVVEGDIRDLLREKLRSTYTYMKHDAIEEYAEDCAHKASELFKAQ